MSPQEGGSWLLDAFPDRQADAIVERLAREEADSTSAGSARPAQIWFVPPST
ncbi:hypothetical protein [Streptomyces hainanensis]|uniref:hypothetical protein n=1 Tax=Streptomyces hainanensis TaxID=402648 RepID=UPI00140460F2|nr:hypothetical protein [Streptomyces hainanensis]